MSVMNLLELWMIDLAVLSVPTIPILLFHRMIGSHGESLVTSGVPISQLYLDIFLYPCGLTSEQRWPVSGSVCPQFVCCQG
jgi:hypothetical protein